MDVPPAPGLMIRVYEKLSLTTCSMPKADATAETLMIISKTPGSKGSPQTVAQPLVWPLDGKYVPSGSSNSTWSPKGVPVMEVTVMERSDAVTPEPGSTMSSGRKNVRVSSYHSPVDPSANVAGHMVGNPSVEVHAGSATHSAHCARASIGVRSSTEKKAVATHAI